MAQFRRENASGEVVQREQPSKKNQHQKELRKAAQQTHSLESMFQRHINNGVSILESENNENMEKVKETHHVIEHEVILRLARRKAGTDLNRLLRLKTEKQKNMAMF